jgi:hypothetical protein
MIGINNKTIEGLLQTCPLFKGVFSCNNIPASLSNNDSFSIVCNLSKVEEPGTHFITIVCFKDYVLYIDSIGMHCFNLDITRFLLNLNRTIFYNTKKIQSITSTYCGMYCVMYILHFNTPLHYQHDNKLSFTIDMQKNDKQCVKNVSRLIKYVNKS